MNMRMIVSKLLGLVTRGEITATFDANGTQTASVTGRHGEALAKVERAQQFGLSSRPPAGTKTMILRVGAMSDHPVLLGDFDPDRPNGLAEGEVRLYDASGSYVNLGSGMSIVSSGALTVEGDTVSIEATAGSTSVNASGKVLLGGSDGSEPLEGVLIGTAATTSQANSVKVFAAP